jgi:hypothetical protein
MSIAKAFATTTTSADITSGNLGAAAPSGTKSVSDFITVQSLTNFSAMTGAIAAAWGGAERFWAPFHGIWFPFALCALFGVVSLVTSRPGEVVAGPDGQPASGQPSSLVRWLQPSFIMVVNTFVLFGAVQGASLAIGAN